jgi:hypothetical protein
MASASETNGAFCMACGAALSADASFCSSCGSAQTPEALQSRNDTHVRDEFCEVIVTQAADSGLLTKWAFVARAVGKEGLFEAGRSASLKRDAREVWDADNERALNGLIAALGADGWEPTGRGAAWFEYRFRREVEYEE